MIILLGYTEKFVEKTWRITCLLQLHLWLLSSKLGYLKTSSYSICTSELAPFSNVLEYRNEEKSDENGKFKQEKCRWVWVLESAADMFGDAATTECCCDCGGVSNRSVSAARIERELLCCHLPELKDYRKRLGHGGRQCRGTHGCIVAASSFSWLLAQCK
jgi:hypothetical protein